MYLLERIVVISGIVIGALLVLTNPAGDNAVAGGVSQIYTSGVKALQGR